MTVIDFRSTLYIIDNRAYEVDGLDGDVRAAARLLNFWLKSRQDHASIDDPFAIGDLSTSLAKIDWAAMMIREPVGHVRFAARFLTEGVDCRVYAVRTSPDAAPQIEVLERRADESRLRRLGEYGLREFISKQVDDHFADKSTLYEIATPDYGHHLVSGYNIEMILDLVKDASATGRSQYTPAETENIIEQLERAQRDHEMRNAPRAPKP